MNIAEAPRRTLTARNDDDRRKPPMVAKGHDIFLKGMQDTKAMVSLTTINGDVYRGNLIARDRWTITVVLNDGNSCTFYKHAIESFHAAAVKK